MQTQPVTFADHIETHAAHHIEAIKAWAAGIELNTPVRVEIGSNRGRFLEGIARLYPDQGIVGIELRRKYARDAERRLRTAGHAHAHALAADANLAIPLLFADKSLRAVYVLFPDPWWKKRHAKRRIITPAFLQLLSSKVFEGGHLIIKTDVEPYADFTRTVFERCPQFRLLEPGDEAYPSDEPAWPLTTREVKIVKKGLPVFRLYAVRTNVEPAPDAVVRAALERFEKPEVTIDNPRAFPDSVQE